MSNPIPTTVPGPYFDGVASDDLAVAFPVLEAAVTELEAQAAAANTTPLFMALGGTVKTSLARTQLIVARLKAINRGA